MKAEPPETPQSGFDAIEYPCDYAFKAVCRVDPESQVELHDVVSELVLAHTTIDSVLGVTSKPSRAGRFESVTITVRLHSRQQLEAIYTVLSESPRVVMTL